MRELAVRIQFSKHCLGNVKRYHWEHGKKRTFFTLPRNHEGKVIFLTTWWMAVLIKAADVLGHHQDVVKSIKFGLEVDGMPRPIPAQFYRRYYDQDRFSKHEAFFPGDCVGLTCLVPDTIGDEDFQRLMTIVGKYYGISPSRPNEYGFFTVVSVQPCGVLRRPRVEAPSTEHNDVVGTRSEPPG